jgi:hypothetical protein
MGFVFALRLAHSHQTLANVKKCHGLPEAACAVPGHSVPDFGPAIDPNLSARDVVGVIASRVVEF